MSGIRNLTQLKEIRLFGLTGEGHLGNRPSKQKAGLTLGKMIISVANEGGNENLRNDLQSWFPNLQEIRLYQEDNPLELIKIFSSFEVNSQKCALCAVGISSANQLSLDWTLSLAVRIIRPKPTMLPSMPIMAFDVWCVSFVLGAPLIMSILCDTICQIVSVRTL